MNDSHRPWLVALAVVLVVSLVINVYGLTRLSRLDGRITQTQGYLSGQIASIQSQVSAVQSAMREAEQATAWYSRPQFDVVGTDAACTTVHSQVSWTFHELSAGATVGLSYRVGEGEWRPSEVENVSGTTYQARLDLPLTTEPSLRTELRPASGAPMKATRIEETAGRQLQVEYVIHATENGVDNGGDPVTLNVSKLVGQFVARVNEVEQGKAYSISVSREAGPECLQVTEGEAWLVGGVPGKLGNVALEKDPVGGNTVWIGTVRADGGTKPTNMGISLTLSNGQKVERTIQLR